MKKILIVTWVQYDNYGSLLQAYCLKKILEYFFKEHKKKIQVQLLNYSRVYSEKAKNPFTKLKNIKLQSISIKISDKIFQKIFNKRFMEIKTAFNCFRLDMLDLYPVKPIHSKKELNDLGTFDFYIAGSDQIWNPKLLDDIYLLDWVAKGKPKISYAPSICVEHLTAKELEKYMVLKSFDALSMREYNGAAKQISEKIHKKIYEVADPVILYGRKNLLKICKKNSLSDYIFSYLLSDSRVTRSYCVKLARTEGLKLKALPFIGMRNLKNDLIFLKYACWDVGPIEFVNLIYNARILITDSFHGLVIALLLHKDFIILPREEGDSEQNNRLFRLLKSLGLGNRFGKTPNDLNEVIPINWDEVDEKIEKMQKYSMDFLFKFLVP